MPRVSIITPIYNAARWLPETLASVRAQTFTDWEHVLVDDRSTDGSVEILESAAREDSRFRVLQTSRNVGPSAARNLALVAARARFIAFLDADDVWLPQKLARSVAWMLTNGYALIYHDYRHMSSEGTRVGALIKAPEVLDIRTLHTRRGHGGCMSIMIDLAQIPDFRFPDNPRYVHEDFCAWLSILNKGIIGHRLPADLGRHRLSTSSRSGNHLANAQHSWRIYREVSKLCTTRAVLWWTEYAWNTLLLHARAMPWRQRGLVDEAHTVVTKCHSEVSARATCIQDVQARGR